MEAEITDFLHRFVMILRYLSRKVVTTSYVNIKMFSFPFSRIGVYPQR